MKDYKDYKVGEQVEILGRRTTGSSYPKYMPRNVQFCDHGELPSEEERVWTTVTVCEVTNDDISVFWQNEDYSWLVYDERFVRPITKQEEISAINMATSCVECHESFMYPVEHNCDQGRLCWGCKTTKAWKYTNLRG